MTECQIPALSASLFPRLEHQTLPCIPSPERQRLVNGEYVLVLDQRSYSAWVTGGV